MRLGTRDREGILDYTTRSGQKNTEADYAGDFSHLL